MEKNGILVKKIDILIIARRVRFLGIAIMVGIILVYGLGLFVSGNYINTELNNLNILSLLLTAVCCFPSFFFRNFLLKKINSKNFLTAYFNAHIVPFALCDMGGLFCVTTNLFVNQNIIYATTGLLVALLFLILNFPRADDYENLDLNR